jgi:hypothetical protein
VNNIPAGRRNNAGSRNAMITGAKTMRLNFDASLIVIYFTAYGTIIYQGYYSYSCAMTVGKLATSQGIMKGKVIKWNTRVVRIS